MELVVPSISVRMALVIGILDYLILSAQFRKQFSNSTTGILRHPSLGIIKKPYCSQIRLWPKIKPVLRIGWHTEQITFFTQYAINLVCNMQIEQTATINKKTHFIFCVDMFTEKLLAQRFFVRIITINTDHIDSN